MKRLLANIELILSAAGLLVIFLVPTILRARSENWWEITAITAILVGLIHGLIFWLIRHRQRAVRHKAIAEIQMMLKDRLNNYLSVVMVSATLAKPLTEKDAVLLKQAIEAIHKISELLNNLSDESLREWQVHYQKAVQELI